MDEKAMDKSGHLASPPARTSLVPARGAEILRRLAENSPDIIYRMSLPDGQYEYVSPAATSVTGYPPETWYERPGLIREIVHPNWRAYLQEMWTRLLNGDVPPTYEFQIVRPDGEVRWMHQRNVLVTDPEGRPTAIEGIVTDITERKQAELVLQDTVGKMRSVFRAAPVGIGVVSNRVIQEVNEWFCEITGYSQEEVVGQSARMLYPSDEDFEWVGREKYRQISQRSTGTVETRFRRKDGRDIDVLLSSTPLDPRDEATGITFTVLDITERKEAERALRRQRDRMQQYLDVAGVMFVALDRRGRIALINRRGCEVLGHAQDDLLGADWFEMCLPEAERTRVREVFARIMAGELDAYEHVESAVVDRFGRERWINWHNALLRDETGEIAGTLSSGEDITERKRALEALVLLESGIEQAMDGIAVVDMEGKVQFVNRAWAEMHGLTRKDALSSTIRQFHSTRQYETQVLPFLDILKDRGEHEGEVGHVRTDGVEFDAWMSSSVIHDAAGAPVGMVAMARDITEQKLREAQFRQAQKMEAIGRLAAGVAHDFNNQLQVILGYCEVLQAEYGPEDSIWEIVSEMRQAADRARATTSHLLAFSRRQILEPKVVDMAEFFTELHGPIGRMIGEDVELVTRAPSESTRVFIDKAGLHQAIMNLAINARDAMPDGGRIEIRASRASLDGDGAAEFSEAAPGEYLLIEVTDTGEGMDEETLDRLFEPFFTTKEQGKGTGLGLAMVQGFVRQSNGFLNVQSRPGEGTTVRLLLPLAPTAHEATNTPAAALDVVRPEGKAVILVVEDEPSVRSLLVRILEGAGYRVLEAATPARALEMMRDEGERPDLVVSDVIMPEMRGDELARRVLAEHGSTQFLFISGYAGISVGRQEVLQKPFGPAHLLERVNNLISALDDG